METDCGVISDPGVIIFSVTDGVTDCAPVSSSVTQSPGGPGRLHHLLGTRPVWRDATENMEEAFVPGGCSRKSTAFM